MVNVGHHQLQDVVTGILSDAGLDLPSARSVSEGLVYANLCGVDTHGVRRISQYISAVRRGEINRSPKVVVQPASAGTAIVDADGGYGYAPTKLACEITADLVIEHGIAAVGVRNSHHYGMAGMHTARLADVGFVAMTTTTTTPLLAPPGGLVPVVGNSPLSWAVPRRAQRPILLDMALSQVAFGVIRRAAAEGVPIAEGLARDGSGNPTTDPVAALEARLPMAIGDHKGFGLAVIAGVLAGVLTGSPFGHDARGHERQAGGVGHLIVALDPARFLPRERFLDEVERLCAQVHDVPMSQGSGAAQLPGEREWAAYEDRTRNGIPLSSEALAALAENRPKDAGLAELLDRWQSEAGV